MAVKIRKGKVKKYPDWLIDWCDKHPIPEERLAGYEKGRAIWVTRYKLRSPHKVAENPVLRYAAKLEDRVLGKTLFYEEAVELLQGTFPVTSIKGSDLYAPDLIFDPIKDKKLSEKEQLSYHTDLTMDSYWVRHFKEMDDYYEKEYGVVSTFRLEGERYDKHY